jgi:hypothetical protein
MEVARNGVGEDFLRLGLICVNPIALKNPYSQVQVGKVAPCPSGVPSGL